MFSDRVMLGSAACFVVGDMKVMKFMLYHAVTMLCLLPHYTRAEVYVDLEKKGLTQVPTDINTGEFNRIRFEFESVLVNDL